MTPHYKKKAKAVQALGGGCQCCGEANLTVLTFDHVNNNGNIDRKTLGVSQSKLMTQVTGGRRDISVLCMNCHHVKTMGETCHTSGS